MSRGWFVNSEMLQAFDARLRLAKVKFGRRDSGQDLVRQVRAGEMDLIKPELFPEDLPKSVVANIIDVSARDTAEMIATLPSLACSSRNMNSAADNRRAELKNRIGTYYLEKSHVARQNIDFCDSGLSYSVGAYFVDPDFEGQCPRIRWENSFGMYYGKDLWGSLTWIAKCKRVTVAELCEMYPDRASIFKRTGAGTIHERSDGTELEMVIWRDRNVLVTYLPECEHHVLSFAKNPTTRVLASIAERPDQEEVPRGQYDDAVWPAMAKARMALYMLRAAHKAVTAPIVIPGDVQEITFGDGAIMKTDNPNGAKRLSLDIPTDVFALYGELGSSIKEGSRYPEVRGGTTPGSIVTGQGVQALMGTLDTQISTWQTIVGEALERTISLCFELDVALWPNVRKTIRGVMTGKPFEVTYAPAKDIGDSWGCKVTYGFASGLSPSQAIVMLLQLRADNTISPDTFRRQLPFGIDPEQEQRDVDVALMLDAARQGLMGLAQSFPTMVLQGQDPMPVLQAIAAAVELRRKGKSMEDVLLEALKPAEQPPAPEGVPGELPPGVRDNGLMEGQAYGQQGLPPGGMPTVTALMSSLRGNGQSRMEAGVMRKEAVA